MPIRALSDLFNSSNSSRKRGSIVSLPFIKSSSSHRSALETPRSVPIPKPKKKQEAAPTCVDISTPPPSISSRHSVSSDGTTLEHESLPPTPPPHTTTFLCPPALNLAGNVRLILGSALEQADQEIELEWEVYREQLKHSLSIPRRPLTGYCI